MPIDPRAGGHDGAKRYPDAQVLLRERAGAPAREEAPGSDNRRRSRPRVRGPDLRNGGILAVHEEDAWNPQTREHQGAGTCAGRSSTPTCLIRTIGDARGGDTSKRRDFQNDALIALTARPPGATGAAPTPHGIGQPTPG